MEAVREYQADKEYPLMDGRYRKLSISELENDFGVFVEKELSHTHGQNLPPSYVPETVYWLVDGDQFIGRLSIRSADQADDAGAVNRR